METTPRTAADLAAEIATRKARSHEISTRLTAADATRDNLRAEVARAVADGKPTEALKKRLVQNATDIEADEAGYTTIQADIKALEEQHKALRIEEAITARSAAIDELVRVTSETHDFICELFKKEVNAKAHEIDAARARVGEVEGVLIQLGQMSGSEATRYTENAVRHVGANGMRLQQIMAAWRDFTAGKPFACSYGFAPPFDLARHEAHHAAAPEWAKAMQTAGSN
ncbi:MAG TPA: hypothetical protein VF719_03680 [Abditibacteriaceae bacterium]|jgi:hypothetical protein